MNKLSIDAYGHVKIIPHFTRILGKEAKKDLRRDDKIKKIL
jgi:hypothetical protein